MKWGKEKVGQRDEQKCHCNGAPPPKVLQYPVNCPFGDASVFSDLIDRKIHRHVEDNTMQVIRESFSSRHGEWGM